MNRFKERILVHWAEWSVIHYRKALLLIFMITLLLGTGFALLQTEMTFFSILPEHSPQVQDLKRITEDFPSASQIILAVDARHMDDAEEAEEMVRKTIDSLIAEFNDPAWEVLLEGATTGIDTDFIRDHGMILYKPEDQERILRIFENPDLLPFMTHLNDDYEREYSGNEDNLEDDEQMAIAQIRGLGGILSLMDRHLQGDDISKREMGEALDRYFFGDSHILSRDNRMGILFLRPTFTMDDFFQLSVIDTMKDRAAEIAGKYGTEVSLTGMIVVGKDEMVTSEQGLGISMLMAFILIILLLVLVFRMKSVPLIAGFPLILGILWATGLTGLVIHRLNIVTAMYMVALIGLGIDFAIHILASYIQFRDDGMDFHPALIHSYRISGSGIITGGLTTAAAFLALSFSKTEMISELGIVAGMGILCEMSAMLMAIPPLLAVRHNRLLRKGKEDSIHRNKVFISSTLTSGLGRFVSHNTGKVATILLAIGLVLATQAGKVQIEDNLMNMEAKGLESIELQDVLVDEFGMAPDGMYVILDDPEGVSTLVDDLDDLDSVKSVEGISWYLPNSREYAERRPLVEEFRSSLNTLPPSGAVDPDFLTEELYRLEMNLIELAEMAFLSNLHRMNNELSNLTGLDKDGIKSNESVFDRLVSTLESSPDKELLAFQNLMRPLLLERLKGMANPERIEIPMLPEVVHDSYISRDGKSYLVFINPRQNPWEGDFRSILTSQVASVTDRGTGMILAADQMNEMARTDGLFATTVSFIVVFLLLLWDFRNLKLTLFSFIPLLLSFTSLFGIMALFDIKFDFVNIISIPLLIGIGIDDAVHINHRYLKEGRGKMERVIAATGTAVLLTTLTTIIGFGSFIPSIMRAMRSTGVVLVIAMSLAFIYSVILHPALLIFIREKLGWSIDAWSAGKEKKQ